MFLIIFLFVFILLSAYFVFVPLYKKRPVLIKKQGLIIYSLSFFILLAYLSHPYTYALAGVIAVLIYILGLWFVYGVSGIMLTDALKRSAILTRTQLGENNNKYKIDNNDDLKIYSLGESAHIIIFGRGLMSKKTRLTVEVFRKFTQNYFIK